MFVLIDPTLALPFSRALMRLLRPSHLRTEGDTDLYCAIQWHPSPDGTYATWPLLVLPDHETVPIHFEADGQELIGLLGMFVAGGALTQVEADGIAQAVQAMAGQGVYIASLIPASWQPFVLSVEQADAAGYFEN